MALNLLVFLIIIPLVFGLPILIGIYVYRDAAKRGMNAALWTLIAMCAPSLLGLIIYLLVRNNYSELTCPNCNTRVEESYVVCPSCRTRLRPSCTVCGTLLQSGWKVCPRCGTEAPEYDSGIATPVKQNDKTIGKILIAILVLPIAIIILLFIIAIPFTATKFGSSGVTSMTMSEFMADLPEEEQIYYNELFEISPTFVDGQEYHLFYYDGGYQNDTYTYQYLICLPNTGAPVDINYSDTREGKLFNKMNYLNFNITCNKFGNEGAVFIYSYRGSSEPPEVIRINHNGHEVELTPEVHIDEPFLPMRIGSPAASEIY